MELQDLDRIRFVTRHFNQLRGLVIHAPFGLVLWAVGCFRLGAVPTSLRYTLSAVTLAAAFWLAWRAAAHYRARFGEVEPRAAEAGAGLDLLVDFGRGVVRDIVGPSAFRARDDEVEARPSATAPRRPSPVGFFWWIVAYNIAHLVLRSIVPDFDGSRAEILFYYLVISALLLIGWDSLGRSRLTAHYPVLAMLILGLAVASRSSALVLPFMGSGATAGWMFLGCLLVLLGLLNHRLLVRTLAPLPPQELQTTMAAAGQRR